jgi:hypothetical protein
LRQEIQDQLRASPARLHLTGLRDCVKQLVGTRRWSGRCQQLSDQIVDYLRQCASHEAGAVTCSIQIR